MPVKSILLLFVVGIGLRAGYAQPPDTPRVEPEIEIVNDAATPEQAIRSFVACLKKKQLNSMWQFVLGARAGQKLPPEYEGFGDFARIEITKMQSYFENSQACVTIQAKIEAKNPEPNQRPEQFTSLLTLFKYKNAWKIIPTSAEAIGRLGENTPWANNPLLELATLIAEPNAFQVLREQALTASAMGYLRQVYFAAEQFSQDHNGVLNFDAKDYTKSLLPYVKNDAIFYLPGREPRQKFSFNQNLNGAILEEIKEPAMILFYTGQDGRLEFPYRDRAIVVFASGVLKIVEKEDAAKLRWKP